MSNCCSGVSFFLFALSIFSPFETLYSATFFMYKLFCKPNTKSICTEDILQHKSKDLLKLQIWFQKVKCNHWQRDCVYRQFSFCGRRLETFEWYCRSLECGTLKRNFWQTKVHTNASSPCDAPAILSRPFFQGSFCAWMRATGIWPIHYLKSNYRLPHGTHLSIYLRWDEKAQKSLRLQTGLSYTVVHPSRNK